MNIKAVCSDQGIKKSLGFGESMIFKQTPPPPLWLGGWGSLLQEPGALVVTFVHGKC